MNLPKSLGFSGAIAAIASFSGPQICSAADDMATGAGLEEVIVTARKRSENLQVVPLSISVVGSERLERDGFARPAEIAKLTPGVTFDMGSYPNDTRPAMRGMQAERGRPSVAVLVDGQDLGGENMYVGGASGALNMRLIDLEQVEVVKGPQSVLYGRSAFAGAINYITRRPDLARWSGRLELEGASGNTRNASGSLNVPVIDDQLAVRLNGSYHETDGFYQNSANGADVGTENSTGGAVSVYYRPRQGVSLLVRYQYQDDRYSEMPTVMVRPNARLPVPGGTYTSGGTAVSCPADLSTLSTSAYNTCTRGVFIGEVKAGSGDVQLSNDPFTNAPFAGVDQQVQLATLEGKFATDFGDFTLLAGWRADDSHELMDGDFSNFAQPSLTALSLSSLADELFRDQQHSYELRWSKDIGPASLLLGAQRMTEHSTLLLGDQLWLRNPASLLGNPIPPSFPLGIRRTPASVAPYPSLFTRNTTYTSYFGSLQWTLSDELRLGVEARYHKDDIDYALPGYTRSQVGMSKLVPSCPAVAPYFVSLCPQAASISESKLTPRVSLDYRLTPDAMAYVTWSRGFKPGGYNVNEVTNLNGQRYKEETVDAAEIGAKTSWADGRILVNGAVFYNDYRDQQVSLQRVDAVSGLAIPGITNAAKVEIKGFEIESTWKFTDHWTASAAYALTDAKFKRFVIGPPPASSAAQRVEAGNINADYSGLQVPKNARHALNAGLEYRGKLEGSRQWFAEGVGTLRSKRYVDDSNLSYMPSYFLFDLRAGLSGEKWSVTAYVDNVFDDDKVQMVQRTIDAGTFDGFSPGRSYLAYLPAPRACGLRAELRF
jgi:iron complex outermembrane recepter protein